MQDDLAYDGLEQVGILVVSSFFIFDVSSHLNLPHRVNVILHLMNEAFVEEKLLFQAFQVLSAYFDENLVGLTLHTSHPVV